MTLYEHADFTGARLGLEADTREVDGALHDKVSSIVVAESGGGGGGSRYVFAAENGDDWFCFEDQESS
ncbi:hypothetical protein [Streptomyces sp. NPDC003522]